MQANLQALRCDEEMAAAFLAELGEKHFFQMLPEGDMKGQLRPRALFGSYDEYAHALKTANLNGFGIFVAVNQCDSWERKAEKVTAVRSLFVDLDGAPIEPVLQCPLEAHMVVESSPGRFHAYWLVEDFPLDMFPPFQRLLASHFQGDRAVCDLPRVMRVPGFLHRKREPYLSTVIIHNNLPRYTLEDVEKAFGPAKVPAPLRPQETKIIELENYRAAPHSGLSDRPKFEKILEGCAFIRHCVEDAEGLSEPKWWSALSIVANCEDGEELSHEISRPYVGYSEKETSRKVQQLLEQGKPHTCRYIQQQFSDEFCEDCSNKGKVKSPISLGRVRSSRTVPSEISMNVSPEVEELNKKYAVVDVGGKTLVMKEIFDLKGRLERTFSSIADFKNRFCNRVVYVPQGDRTKEVPLGHYWLNSAARREYDRLVFMPGAETPSEVYNLYRGLAVEAVPGDWSLGQRHILEVICDGNQEVYDYLLAYMARMVQSPGGERPGVSVVLVGEQGTGKGEFIRQFGKIFGCHFLQIFNQHQLTGRFNSHFSDKILVYVDEGFWAGDKGAEGVLKGLITEPTLAIEHKGKDIVTVDNHVNLFFSSNNEWVIPAGLEERRYLVLKVSSRYGRNHDYFAQLRRQMDNGGCEAMLYDLLHMDISGVNLRQVPRTQALFQQIVQSLGSVEAFWFHSLLDAEFPSSEHMIRNYPAKEVSPALEGWHVAEFIYQHYLGFCRQMDKRHPELKSQFTRTLKRICPQMRLQRATNSAVAGSKRPNGYEFPSLEECRKSFEAVIRIPIPWDELTGGD